MIGIDKTVDLNRILKLFNFGILFLLWYSYLEDGDTTYVNFNTVLLGTLLSFQIGVFLYFEKKRRDPFVILLCLQMVFYFLLRIYTLHEYSFSVVFLRYPFFVQDLNYSLFFILIANCVFYLGLSINCLKFQSKNEILNFLPKHRSNILVLLAIGYFFTFYRQIGLGSLAGIIDVLNGTFLNIATILLMVLVYFFLFRNKLSKSIKLFIILGVLIFVVLQTLIGSRSAILTLLNFLLFSILAIKNYLVVKRKYLSFFLFLAPLMILIFSVTTFLRLRVEERSTVGEQTIEVIKEFDIESDFLDSIDLVLMGVGDRIGFLDYCAEIINNNEEYSTVFNAQFYFKSTIDNVLSPGFDVFDTPKTSNALRFIYNKEGEPKKSKVAEAYQSDEFTMYGEFYALFGKWFSLIPIFFTGFIFKWIYLRLKKDNIYLFYLKRAFVLYVFWIMLNSFGIDWLFLDIFSIFFTYQIFKGLLR
ncbi:O-antigen polymerase [Chryseobacterium taiwanense]|uniref:O-antigen polymerase n=1 Tax=Chryseobacterium taiwanense TaxID=363331 RepID=A0A0B4DG86_9FLAO|nr:O-antigen polymerase [Chryseobacterium taiwanense]KIC63425.1 hypothetical protein RM51_07040 [Chryseobacterium taiwanense]